MTEKHYIKLISPDILDKAVLKDFYNIVLDVAASTVELNEAGKPYTYTKEDNKHIYCIYLSRCLTDSEWNHLMGESLKDKHNFDGIGLKINISQQKDVIEPVKVKRLPDFFAAKPRVKEEPEASGLDWNKIAEEFSKHNHDMWVESKLNHGWRWSTHFDLEQKTHPLLIAWEQLPKEYKQIDPSLEVFFTSLLASLDYQIVKAD